LATPNNISLQAQLPVAVAISKRQLTLPLTQAGKDAQKLIHFVSKLTQGTVELNL